MHTGRDERFTTTSISRLQAAVLFLAAIEKKAVTGLELEKRLLRMTMRLFKPIIVAACRGSIEDQDPSDMRGLKPLDTVQKFGKWWTKLWFNWTER